MYVCTSSQSVLVTVITRIHLLKIGIFFETKRSEQPITIAEPFRLLCAVGNGFVCDGLFNEAARAKGFRRGIGKIKLSGLSSIFY